MVSAKKKKGLKLLLNKIISHIPYRDWFYEKNMKNENINYTISEITREKIFRLLNKELPYVVNIKTDLIHEKEILRIFQRIFVRKESQKAILIGKNGSKIKQLKSFSEDLSSWEIEQTEPEKNKFETS